MNVSRSSATRRYIALDPLRGTTNGVHDMRRRSEFSEHKDGEALELSGWRVIVLWGLYAFLGALAAAIVALVGTFPDWI